MANLLASVLKFFTFRSKALFRVSAQQFQMENVNSHGDPLPSVQTRYMKMLLHLDEIPRLHTMLAGLFTWVLLAGYIVFPGTFTSLRNSKAVKDATSAGTSASMLVNTVQNVPLLWLAAICCIVGVLGMVWLWWRWQENYIWLSSRIFL